MAKKEAGQTKKTTLGGLSNESFLSVIAIIFFVLGIIILFASFGQAGPAGLWVNRWLEFLFGYGTFILPIVFFAVGGLIWRGERPKLAGYTLLSSLLLIFSLLGIGVIVFGKTAGGLIGELIASPLINLFDRIPSLFIFWGIFFISGILLFDSRPRAEVFGSLKNYLISLIKKLFNILVRKKETLAENTPQPETKNDPNSQTEIPAINSAEKTTENNEKEVLVNTNEVREKILKAGGRPLKLTKKESFDGEIKIRETKNLNRSFVPPPLSLLEKDRGKPGVGDIKQNASIIKRTLQTFGISVEMDEISIGPTVTQYALKPAEGVRVAKIAGLQHDLALALAVESVRIEAPIPGKSLVGIEVPNASKSMVGLGTLFNDERFSGSETPLLLALGKDITGRPRFANLAKMPHLLIAGTTGSGKSVTVHSIVTSLLYRNAPEDLRFIMVDPKKVELTFYNSIPHLLTPVITSAKQAILALKWAVKEMERRYDVLEAERVKNIDSYHKTVFRPAFDSLKNGADESSLPERMPYIVIIIDELADIMSIYPKELESGIVRLAQMSRAVGIHIILSTQRPEVRVITGLIKANIPGRVALKVASQIDSRTILDMAGAEKLLGAGDILYSSGETAKPERLQSAFISEEEIKRVVNYLAANFENTPDTIELSDGKGIETNLKVGGFSEEAENGDDEALFGEAREIVVRTGKASTSYLQTKLKLGYARAARIMELLEERGVVGPADGSKRREVLEKPEDLGDFVQGENGSSEEVVAAGSGTPTFARNQNNNF